MTVSVELAAESVHRRFREIAKCAALSKFYAAKTESECFVIIMTGDELGLSPMQSLRGIHIIQGKPVLSADLCHAIILKSGLCEYWEVVSSSDKECTIETQRCGGKPVRRQWTWADAERAKLTGKDNWKSYPQEMLRHRCVAALARQVYPDLLLGLYIQDEMDRADRQDRIEQVHARPVVDSTAELAASQSSSKQLEAPNWLERIRADLKGAQKGVIVLSRYAQEISQNADITALPVDDFITACREYLAKAPTEKALQDAVAKIKAEASMEFADAIRPALDKLADELRAKHASVA